MCEPCLCASGVQRSISVVPGESHLDVFGRLRAPDLVMDEVQGSLAIEGYCVSFTQVKIHPCPVGVMLDGLNLDDL